MKYAKLGTVDGSDIAIRVDTTTKGDRKNKSPTDQKGKKGTIT
jgi:hypothetical protein